MNLAFGSKTFDSLVEMAGDSATFEFEDTSELLTVLKFKLVSQIEMKNK